MPLPDQGTTAREPRVIVELSLEGEPAIRLLAGSAEDEARILTWLLRSRALRHLGLAVFEALDAYDRSVR